MEPTLRLDQTDPLLGRARSLLEQGRASEAADLLGLEAPEGPRSAVERRFAVLHAEALLYAGRVDDARKRSLAVFESESTGDERESSLAALSIAALCRLRTGDADDRVEVRRELMSVLRETPRHQETRARLQQALAIAMLQLGELDTARIVALRALHSARTADDRWREAMLLDTLGNIHSSRGDELRALRRFDESIELKRALGDRFGEAVTQGGRGRTLLRSGDPQAAIDAFEENLRLSRDLGNFASQVTALDLLGLAYLEMDEPAKARHRLDEAVALASTHEEEVTDRQRALLAKDLALVEERLGNVQAALERLSKAEEMFASRNVRDGAGFCANVAGRIFFRANELEHARARYARAIELLRGHPHVDLALDALVHAAEVESLLGLSAEAEAHLVVAERLAEVHSLRGWLVDIQKLRRGDSADADRIMVRSELGLGGTEREYVLLEHVAGGAQGAVWKAWDARGQAHVAVKMREISSDAEEASRDVGWWQTELRAAAAVDHPSVVEVFGYQRIGSRQYLVMEWIEGHSLLDRIRSGPVPLALGQRWVRQIASGLRVMHAAGVIHRDLKPGNVMLRNDEDAVIVDFGGARFGVQEEGDEGLTGTPGYLPPEILRGTAASAASDHFAFGLIVAEILTGTNPLSQWVERESLRVYLSLLADEARVAETRAAIVDRVRAVAPDLAPHVHHLLSSDPDERVAGLEPLAED